MRSASHNSQRSILPFRWLSFLCLASMILLASSALVAQQDDNAEKKSEEPSAAKKEDKPTEPPKADSDAETKPDSKAKTDDTSKAEEKEPSLIETIDKKFGDYVVSPIGKIIFFPLYTDKRGTIVDKKGAVDLANKAAEQSDAEQQTKMLYKSILDKDPSEFRHGKLVETLGKKIQEFKKEPKKAQKVLGEGAEANAELAALASLSSEIAESDDVSVPLVVAWLFAGAVFFTLRMGFINFRGFWHAIRLTKGDYDDPNEVGEVSHFQALSSALSATVGLGNIAGVAIAIGTGGPGACFWMIVVGLLGMSTKFTECTLGQMYRKVEEDGTVSGGPMRYLKDGLSEIGLAPLGAILSILFAIICIGASFGGGCAFQVVQSLGAIKEEPSLSFLKTYPWVYGVIMAVMAGVVIIGGIKSIGAVASKIVPFMCAVYVLAVIYILATNLGEVGGAFTAIFSQALSPQAAFGGFLGVLVQGIRRAVFSNEAGAGSAAIAHSAAKTDEPVSEGTVALLEPFIDTVVVCTMTALVIIITGVYEEPANEALVAGNQGAALTAKAFVAGGHDWFRWILYAAVVLFAYSTLISWSYYGERCWTSLFGKSASIVYKIIFLGFVLLGSVVTESKILDFSDLLILGMAFPNVLGLLLLSGKVRSALDEYWNKYKSGELDPK